MRWPHRHRAVHDTINRACDEIIDAGHYKDTGVEVALSLLVNATMSYLEGSASTLGQVARQDFDASLNEVLSWIDHHPDEITEHTEIDADVPEIGHLLRERADTSADVAGLSTGADVADPTSPTTSVPVTFEARCLACQETFIPHDVLDMQHAEREDGRPCGGQGRIIRTIPSPEGDA